MGRVTRIDEDRVQLAAVRRLVLVAADSLRLLGVVVEARDWRPVSAPVLAAKQALRRGARLPDLRLAEMSRRQPEDAVDGSLTGLALRELRGRKSFLPARAAVVAAADDRSQVPLARGRQEGAAVAGVLHDVMALRPLERRLAQGPRPSIAVARGDEDALPRREIQPSIHRDSPPLRAPGSAQATREGNAVAPLPPPRRLGKIRARPRS